MLGGVAKFIWLQIALTFFVFHNSQCAYLRCYKGSIDSYTKTTLEKGSTLIDDSCLNLDRPVDIYTFGYNGKVDGPATLAVANALLNKNKTNFILVDWQDEASSGSLGIPLGYAFKAVPKSKKIGLLLGEVLVKLAKAGLNMTDVHLMGHSLGAHLLGFAGRRTRELGYTIARITGLDPAWELFEGVFGINGLDRTCAKFVDVIHTDPGGYGISESIGTVDLWPNYSGSVGIQPGCPVGDFETFSTDAETVSDDDFTFENFYVKMLTKIRRQRRKRKNLCSHDRSWKYYVESIEYPTAFPAQGAPDVEDWYANANINGTIYMGILANPRASGNYYLSTNSESLFGKGDAGLRPANETSSR